MFDKKFIKFVIVGVINTLNYSIVYTILLNSIDYLMAHIFAFLFSAFCSYFLTTYFTFSQKATWETFLRFPLTFLPNFIISSLGVFILVDQFGFSKQYTSIVLMLAIIPVTFLVSKVIFKEKNEKN